MHLPFPSVTCKGRGMPLINQVQAIAWVRYRRDWERQTRSINHRDFQCQRVRAFNRDTHLRRLSTAGENLDGGDTVGYLTPPGMLKEIAIGNYEMAFAFTGKCFEIQKLDGQEKDKFSYLSIFV